MARGISRESEAEGRDQAERLHRDRYHVAEQLYVTELGPKARADAIVDNADYSNPIVARC